MGVRAADVIVEVLAEAGVKRCYGIPGDTLAHVTEAIRTSSIRFVHVRHEEAGAFAAAAEAQLTGELAMCAGSCGPGSLHFINGIYEAHRNRAPVVLIASQIVREELGVDFPQEVDFRAIYRPCSVFCEEVRTPDHAERMTVLAAQAALNKRGVAVLIVPADVASGMTKRQGLRVHHPETRLVPSDAELRRLAAVINQGSRVAIYGGSGCREAHDQVVALADLLKAPVAFASRAKDFLSYDNPFAVGMTGVVGIRSGFKSVLECDTLVLLGCDFAWKQFYPDAAKIVQIDIDPTHLGRRHPVTVGAAGDIGPTLDALLPLLHAREDRSFLNRMIELRDETVEKLERPAKVATGAPIHPQYMVETIARHAADDAVWAVDDGSATVWCLRHVPATGKNRTLASLLHGTMAAGLSSALGVKAAYPNRQVINLAGDGGLGMMMGELLTVVQENLPIKIAVVNNGSLGFVELEQKVEGLLDCYTDLHNPDFGKVATACGIWGRRVERAEDLEAAVAECLAQPGPALLDVAVGRFELVMPPAAGLSQAFGMALYSVRAVLAGRTGDLVGMVRQNLIA